MRQHRENDFAQAFIQCFGPDKADVIYDCAGNNVTMGQAIANARKGSTILLVAVFATRGDIDLAVLNDHELDLNTSMMYRNEDYLIAIEPGEPGQGAAETADLQTLRLSGLSEGLQVYRRKPGDHHEGHH